MRFAVILFTCAFTLVHSLLASAADRPNIVVLLADDLAYAELGFQGCRETPTPHLDALANSGVRCTSGYVSHPFCSPTRAGLLTGRYQQRFGFENNPLWAPDDMTFGLPTDQVTVADAMRQAGYVTGAVGKWHLGAHPQFHPNRRGFTEYFGMLGGGHQYFDHNQFQTNPTRAKQEYFIPLLRNSEPVPESEYLTDALGREAASFIDRHASEPFFLYVAFNAPHAPLQAPEEYLERVKHITDPTLKLYAAMVCGMDDAVGRITATLQKHKLDRRTLIFFLSDNGGPSAVTNCRNTPLRGAKGQLYEGGIRVPFVVSWPGRLKPGTFGEPVSSLDIFPTCLSVSNGKVADSVQLDGVDLLPHLGANKPTALADRTLFWRTGGGIAIAARQGKWKYVSTEEAEDELFNLESDIAESIDVAKQQPQQFAILKGQVDRWNEQLMAPRFASPKALKSGK